MTSDKPPASLLSRALQIWEGPKVIDFWLSWLNPLWSWDQAKARIVQRIPEAEGTVTLILQPNRHFKGLKPGQHVNIGVESDGIRHLRSYSASDTRRGDGRLQITVKATESGKISQILQTIPIGSIVSLSPAFGELELPQDDHGVLLLAAGSGVTPMLSLIHDLAAHGFPRPVKLMVWARTRAQQIQVGTLRALAQQYPNFRVRFALTGEPARSSDEIQGRITGEHLQQALQSVPHVLACGPHAFVQASRELTAGLVRSFNSESFTPPPRIQPADGAETQGTVQVTLARTGKTLEIPLNMSLLEALEAHGLSPQHGCRMGICNTCACGKSDGATRNLHDNHINHEPLPSVRLCMHAAHTDLTLDL